MFPSPAAIAGGEGLGERAGARSRAGSDIRFGKKQRVSAAGQLPAAVDQPTSKRSNSSGGTGLEKK
jgi:hypothetical protein